MSKVCTVFKPFSLAPEVCDECGQPADGGSHTEKRADMLPYKEAIWKFLIKKGGTYDFYGGYGYDSKEIRDHVAKCGLDFDKMSTPEMDTVGEFNGTFATSSYYATVVSGYVVCNCEKYPDSEWGWKKTKWILRDFNLGELIWNVVKAGEGK